MKTMTDEEWVVWYVELALDMLKNPSVDKPSKREWTKVLETYLPQVEITIRSK